MTNFHWSVLNSVTLAFLKEKINFFNPVKLGSRLDIKKEEDKCFGK